MATQNYMSLRSFLCGILLSIQICFLFVITNHGMEISSRPDRGTEGKATQIQSEIDSINLQNGNLSLQIPLAQLPPLSGGKLSGSLVAYYNSKLYNSHSIEEYGETLAPGCRPRFSTSYLTTSNNGGWRIGGTYQLIFRSARDDYEYIWPDGELCFGNDFYTMTGIFFKPVIISPDGSEHELRISGNYQLYPGDKEFLSNYYRTFSVNPFNSPTGLYSVDGTYIKAIAYPPQSSISWELYLKDGTRVVQYPNGEQRITDTNGNSLLYGEGFIRDEQTGREIRKTNISIDGVPITRIQYQRTGGEWVNVDVVWGTTRVQGKTYQRQKWFFHNGDAAVGNDTCYADELYDYTFPVIREIVLPPGNLSDPSRKYRFTYNSDTTEERTLENPRWTCNDQQYPSYTTQASYGWGELSEIETPTGARYKYRYTYDGVHHFIFDGAASVTKNAVTVKNLIHDGQTDEWFYEIDISGLATGGSVISSDGSKYEEVFYPVIQGYSTLGGDGKGGLQVKAKISNRILIEKSWTLLGGILYAFGSWSHRVSYNPVVDTEYTTLLAEDGVTRLKMSAKKFQYDYNGELIKTIEYDWFDPATVTYTNNDPLNGVPTGVPTNAPVLRVTNNTYYNQASDASSPYAYHQRAVGNGATVILGKLKETTVGTEAAVKSTTRFSYDGQIYGTAPTVGNLTRVSAFDDATNSWVNTTTTYTARGNVQSTTDANGNITQFVYGLVGGFTDLYPTQTIQAYGTSVARTSSRDYDFYTGLVTTATDVDNNVSTVTEYDALGRPTKVRSAAGTSLESWTRTEYDDVNRRVVVRSDIEQMGDGRKVAIQHFDQLGRVRLARTLEDPLTEDPYNETHGIKVETRYRAAGPCTFESMKTCSFQL
ncbi:MAG: hypothetical protein AB1477_12175, partial [Acidobacteriota bacterium]